MNTYHVRAEPLSGEGPSAIAIVVAENREQALLLLRKDYNFSGYRLPPAEMRPFEASNEQVSQVLGAPAAHEIGVYGFTTLGEDGDKAVNVPPAAVS